MFRSAAQKISHSAALPALSLHKDLRALQDLITSEKAILQTLHKLSADFVRASECLRIWGRGEGEDLTDTLSASTTLLMHLASAFAQFASHEETVRTHMKAVRKAEESLDELKKRRKVLGTQADAADKKLSRIQPEHKNYVQHVEMLNNLREQIRSLDWEILTEEAKLGDFKRTSSKNWMLLKFGGLLECAEKATIVGELGRLVVDEIPLDVTQPGQPRILYAGQEKTQKLVSEAQRCIAEVVFDPSPINETTIHPSSGIPNLSQSQADLVSPGPATTQPNPQSPPPPMSPRVIETLPPRADSLRALPSAGLEGGIGTGSGFLAQTVPLPSPGLGMEEYTSPITDTFPAPTSPKSPTSPAANASYDEFGVSGERVGRERAGTMPVSGTSGQPGSLPSEGGRQHVSLNAGAAGWIGSQFSTVPARGRDSVSQYLLREETPAVAGDSTRSSFSAEIADALARTSSFSATDRERNAPPSSYIPPGGLTEAGLPRGAQPPSQPNAWVPKISSATREENVSDGAPMENPYEGIEEEEEEEEEMEHDREEGGETELAYARRHSRPPRAPMPAMWENRTPLQHQDFNEQEESPLPPHPSAQDVSTDGFISSSSIDVSPSDFPLPGKRASVEEEKALNAAAAREVAREMDTLSFNPPPTPTQITRRPPPREEEPVAPSLQSLQAPSRSSTPSSPLAPPAPPFAAGRAVSPDPNSAVTGSGRPERPRLPVMGSETPGSTRQAPSQSIPSSPLSPSVGTPIRPSIRVEGVSGQSTSTTKSTLSGYATPPEYPTSRFGSSSPRTPSGDGPRTISASAFKRAGMRTPGSDSGSPVAIPGGPRPFPEVAPLTLRKKSSLSSGQLNSSRGKFDSVDSLHATADTKPFSPSGSRVDLAVAPPPKSPTEDYDFIASYGDREDQDSGDEHGHGTLGDRNGGSTIRRADAHGGNNGYAEEDSRRIWMQS